MTLEYYFKETYTPVPLITIAENLPFLFGEFYREGIIRGRILLEA